MTADGALILAKPILMDFAEEIHPPADVVEAVDSIRHELGPDADVNAVIAALRARNLGFLNAIMGLRAIKGTPLADAKWLIHRSPAYADTAEDREESWKALYEEAMAEAEHNPDNHAEQ